ncbi:MAG TPA: SRPBCC family protein [Ktedonobacterales bacterium]|nr:SRPBCC family protein [Ktedonobacterales bacterium]
MMTQTESMMQQTTNASAPLQIQEHITVRAPAQRAYEVWHDFTRFPEFMSNVEEVRPIAGNRYHWVARVFGTKQEWDAEVTESTPNERIAWRSVSGAPNAGTVSMQEREPGITDVQVTLEYSPPAGEVGKTLDKLTKATHREVKEDLRNFKRQVSAPINESLLQPEAGPTEFGTVVASLAGPLTGAAIGGLTAYMLRREAIDSIAWNQPASWVSVPVAQAARWRAGAFQSPLASAQPVSTPAAILSWGMVGATFSSVALSAALRLANRRRDALFVGQWAPTFLGWSLLARLQGHRGVRHDRSMSVASWSVLGASLGSVIASAFHHVRGKRNDGLFIGQWAPTLMIGSSLVRLLNR